MRDLYQTKFVLGEGPVPCDLMLIGEAPGKDEDTWERPFIGRAGNLLTRILRGKGFHRPNIYITNAVKQRPPANRTPFFQEIMLHRNFLMNEIEEVNPKVIICLGKTAIKSITGTDISVPISCYRERRNYFELNNIPVVCTYHPAVLFHDSSRKKMIEEDLDRVKIILTSSSKVFNLKGGTKNGNKKENYNEGKKISKESIRSRKR